MDIEAFRLYCLSKKSVTESFPFNESALVFKVYNKMFALCNIDNPDPSVNLKCSPNYAIELRDEYGEAIRPGYHMNKKHWNTVQLEWDVPEQLLRELIDHSYDLVVKGLPKRDREALLSEEE